MSLLSAQGGRRRLISTVLAVVLCLVLFGCGKTTETLWEPTTEDTAGIKAVVEANKAYFRIGLAELALQYCDTALPGTTRAILAGELEGNPYKSRFRPDSFRHVLDTAAYDLEYTFVAQLDTLKTETTCTVTMAETIPGTLRLHAWEKTDSVGVDTIEVSVGESLFMTRYSDTMTLCDTFIDKPINGASIDGCVLKKVDGVWQLWKIGGGGRFYAPGPDKAPYIVSFFLNSSTRVDTVTLRPDTLHYGIQRFFSVDTADHELLTFALGDWVAVTNLVTDQGQAYDYLYFNGQRYAFRDTVRFDTLTPGKIYRLYLEHIPPTVLWEVVGDYNATVWGVPIRIQ